MEALRSLLDSLLNLFYSLVDIVVALGELILPWSALILFIAYWLLCVNWVSLRSILLRGGWVGLVLIGLVMVLVWGSIAPPMTDTGTHNILGLQLSNFVGKTVYVTMLFCIILLCGSVQLSGSVKPLLRLQDEDSEPSAH